MSVIAKIVEYNPKHNVLADAQVKIDGRYDINGIQLFRNHNTNTYRVSFPVAEAEKAPCIEINDRQLNEKILDAVVAKYESGIRNRMNTMNWTNFDEIEMDRIRSRNRQNNKNAHLS